MSRSKSRNRNKNRYKDNTGNNRFSVLGVTSNSERKHFMMVLSYHKTYDDALTAKKSVKPSHAIERHFEGEKTCFFFVTETVICYGPKEDPNKKIYKFMKITKEV